jgi:4-amino-4-deoxy-L-arabinose transferase-like glycosyltransferase
MLPPQKIEKMKKQENITLWLVILLIFGFCLRVLAVIVFPDTNLQPSSDNYFFDQIAKGILHGTGFHEGNLYAYRPPLFPFFLSFIYLIFGEFPKGYYPFAIIQCVLGTISVYLLYKIVYLLSTKKIAFIAAAIFCFFPTFVILSSQLLSENLFFFFLLLGFFYFIKSLQDEKIYLKILAGLFLGIATLAREVTLYFLVFMIITMFLKKTNMKQFVFGSIIFLVAFFAAISPWLIRNYQVFHVPLITTNGGINFYAGNNASANGSYQWVLPPGTTWVGLLKPSEVPIEKMHELELNTHKKGFSEGLRWIGKEPLKFTTLTIKRIVFFWLPPFSDIKNFEFSPAGLMRYLRFFYTLIVTFIAIPGIFILLKKHQPETLLILFWIVYTTLLHGLIIYNHRYSLTLFPFLCFAMAVTVQRFYLMFFQGKNRCKS